MCKSDWDGHCTIGYDNWKQNKAKRMTIAENMRKGGKAMLKMF